MASIIIPVYNKEKYLQTCFETLDAQTIDHSSFEAIFVNDGSTDGSLAMLKRFSRAHEWAQVIDKENGGVCSARNSGIDRATGKYIFYLDPDDELLPDTLERVSSFFELHDDEVDLVTYPIVPYNDGRELPRHFRFDYLTSPGVYDINSDKYIFICQTTMNICVKNRFKNNHHFNFKSSNDIIYHEDQQYITEILLESGRIGYCDEGSYRWNKNSESTTNTIVKPYYIFENTINMYETLFSRYPIQVPRYLQSLLVHDLGWKMTSSAALPTHLQGDDYAIAMERLAQLVDRVDDDIFVTHPSMDAYHALFFLGMKSSSRLETIVGPGGVSTVSNGLVLQTKEWIEVCILRSRIHGGQLDIVGVVKSPLLMNSDVDFHLYVRRSTHSEVEMEELSLGDSGINYYLSNVRTMHFLSFRTTLVLDNLRKVEFLAKSDGVSIPVRFTYNRARVSFSEQLLNTVFMKDKKIVSYETMATIVVTDREDDDYKLHLHNISQTLSGRVRMIRRMLSTVSSMIHRRYREVWIYTDAPQRLDNAWLQYLHDISVGDDVLRFYIVHNVHVPHYEPEKNSFVIPYGTKVHKLVHYIADKRLFSDISRSCISPWEEFTREYYADFDNAELIYLQHGVLWAHMPWYYSYDRVLTDREVVSTKFEIDNLTRLYGFKKRDLITSGMPRYDSISCERCPERKILVCPSWRSYLVGELTPEGRSPLLNKFIESDYYKNLVSLLRNERLLELLEKHGYTLDFKLHPNFSCYSHLFKQESDLISVVENVEDEGAYAVVVTDYSSYCFDFVYLGRAIVFYIPDEELFRAGISGYNDLDMDLSDAMGEYVNTPEGVVGALKRILENSGLPCEPYLSREKSFFLHYDNMQRDRLYSALCEGGSSRLAERVNQ